MSRHGLMAYNAPSRQMLHFLRGCIGEYSASGARQGNITTGRCLQQRLCGDLGLCRRISRRHQSSDADGRGSIKGTVNGRRNSKRVPPLSSLLDEVGTPNFGRRKLGNELKLRCTEIDENGNVITVNGEFKKSELIAKVGHFGRCGEYGSRLRTAG